MREGDDAPNRISLLIADSSRLACELLSYALTHLAHDFFVIAAVTTSRELLAAADEHEPDVVMISADLEDGSTTGLLALGELHTCHPNIGCVMLMDARSRHLVVDAFRAGARGMVSRAEPLSGLCECIRIVHQGRIWARSAEIEQIVHALSVALPVRAVAANGDELLTVRQKQIVTLVSEGLSNREISQRLNLSEHTVKNYLFRIFDKLGVSSRAELIIYAMHQQSRAA